MAKKQSAEAPASAFDTATLADIKEWNQLTEWMATAKAREMQLRTKLTAHFFSNPTEGVNRLEGPGYEIVLDYKINRTLDVPALDSVMPQLPEDFRYAGVLIEYKPALCMKGFRLLEAMPQYLKTFQQALIEKPGAPDLHINLLSPAMDPAMTPAVPDWPAQQSAAAPAPKLPIMDAYAKAKAKSASKSKKK